MQKAAQLLLRSPAICSQLQHAAIASTFGAQQFRGIGGDKIPEFWGKPSEYTEGTAFLGTPPNHLELIKKRPLSPDVLEIDGKSAHYKFPVTAISSIANRVTGVAMSVGFATAGVLALRGSLEPTVAALQGSLLLGFPLKFLVAYSILYHWLGGMRHIVWDHAKYGNQADRTSMLEVPKTAVSSKVLLGTAAGLALVCALL